jgi:predicted DNA-binding WGR domain protein
MKRDIPEFNQVMMFLEFSDVYVCTEDNHYKFWTARIIEPNIVEATYGVIGGTNQVHRKECYDPQGEIDRKIKEKLRKGYEKL